MGAGLTRVSIKGFNNGTVDLSTFTWTYKVLYPSTNQSSSYYASAL